MNIFAYVLCYLKNVNMNGNKGNGASALFEATQNGDAVIFTVLLEEKSNTNTTKKWKILIVLFTNVCTG